MFEYHGWITVRETTADDDDETRLRPRSRVLATPSPTSPGTVPSSTEASA
ncbi:Imm7 family immunity protein [Streptomyces sp. NPDC005813]